MWNARVLHRCRSSAPLWWRRLPVVVDQSLEPQNLNSALFQQLGLYTIQIYTVPTVLPSCLGILQLRSSFLYTKNNKLISKTFDFKVLCKQTCCLIIRSHRSLLMHNWVLPLDGARCRCSWTNALTPGDIFSGEQVWIGPPMGFSQRLFQPNTPQVLQTEFCCRTTSCCAIHSPILSTPSIQHP